MTMVRRAHELTPAQARGMAAKKAKISTISGPLLARGRSENILQSRSPSPSDEEMDMGEEVETTTEMTESNMTQDPSSPTSGIFSSAASFSPPSFPLPSLSRTIPYSAVDAQREEEGHKRRRSQNWVPTPINEEPRRDRLMLAGLLNTDQPPFVYPSKIEDSPAALQSPSSSVVSPPFTPATPSTYRRPSESAFRPIAIRPSNQPIKSEVEESPDQKPRTAAGKPKGVKKPYKSQEEKDKVKAVRNFGACLRCSIMRQACNITEPGQPCDNCRVPRRKFSISCTRKGPAKRWDYLFPELVTSRHAERNHKVIEADNVEGKFSIPLTHVSGFSLNVPVAEDPSISKTELVKRFFVEEGAPQNCVQRLTEDSSAPLVPVISTNFQDVSEWIAQQVANNRTELLAGLPSKIFPESKGQDWPRDTLYLFQEFHEKAYQSKLIHKVFRTMVVRLLMSRRFYVPFDRMGEVNSKLSTEFQETEIDLQMRSEEQICMVPIFVNKYLKAALMHLLLKSLEQDFGHLEDIFKLSEKSPGSELTDLDRDEALCYVAMILLITSIMQIKILQVALSRDNEASVNCPFGRQTETTEMAKGILQTIETEVIDHVLGLWTYKFVKSHRKGNVAPTQLSASHKAEAFGLVGRFNDLRQAHTTPCRKTGSLLAFGCDVVF